MQSSGTPEEPAAAQLDGTVVDRLWSGIVEAAPTVVTAVIALVALVLVSRWLESRRKQAALSRFRYHSIMLGLTLAALVCVVLTLEVELRQDVLRLLGILLSAAIAFSSATLVANAMSGLMLRAQRDFRSGDYIEVGDYYGGVVERGLFFTELQNELRDRVTLPNAYLTQNPVTVIRPEQTLIEAKVSLGYDVSRTVVEPLLVGAAEAARLEEPRFVEILELGDSSIQYRVVGMYPGKLKDLPTARSELRAQVLDSLHSAGVEIVSPNFMNQRVLAEQQRFVPTVDVRPEEGSGKRAAGRTRFDEAEDAASAERLGDLLAECEKSIGELEERLGASDDPAELEKLRHELARTQRKREALAHRLEQREEKD